MTEEQLFQLLEDRVAWHRAGIVPVHVAARELGAQAQTALALATRPHALDDPVKSFLTIPAPLQAWVLRQRNCADLVGSVVGRDSVQLLELLGAVDARLRASRERMATLLGG